MNLKRVKKLTAALTAALCIVMLGGCGDEIPEMTPEQTELVTEYSAALLLKYDSGTPSRLLPEGSVVSVAFVDPSNPGAVSTETIPEEEETADIPVDAEPEYTVEDMTVTDATTGAVSEPHGEGFAGFLQGTGVDITYSGSFEICDSYPEADELNPYVTVDASEGNKLLIIHFTMTNVSGQDVSVNLNSLGLRYRVSVNGGKNRFAMTSFLANDLLTYVGDLTAGESADVVAVFDIPAEEAADIHSLSFTVRGSDYSSVMSLI